MHVNEGFNATALFSTCPNPLVCQAVSDLPHRSVVFDDKGDVIIPMLAEQNPRDSTGPAVIEDASDDLSECSLDNHPLPLNDISSLADSLPNVEEDVDDMATVTSADDPELVDAKDDEQDDPDIPQLNQSDLERLKAAMTDPLSPSQNEFLQWHVQLQNFPFTRMNQHQKRTKNQTNICVQYVHDCTEPLKPFSSIFGSFLDAGSASKTKPNQNQTKIYEFVVWFWYGFGLI